MWETYENVAEYNKELLESYYVQNPPVEKDGRFGKQTRRKLIRKKN
jgi:hypothetical protein